MGSTELEGSIIRELATLDENQLRSLEVAIKGLRKGEFELVLECMAAERGSLSKTLIRALRRAIVDSGASHTYVPGKVPLDNCKPGQGSVWTATGNRENVSEMGEMGPMMGVRKVDNFTRPLVAVSDLTDQFGGVYFDSKHVFVVSEREDGSALFTCIGERNAVR